MARANGFNVGVDAHIGPHTHVTNLDVEWGKKVKTSNQAINRQCIVGAATSRPKPHGTALYVEWDRVN